MSYNYPSNINIIKFTDYGIEENIGDGEFLGDIGEAENYVYEDLNEKVTPDDSTPSSIDFTPRKKGVISSDGTVVKEPFAFEIKKPNIQGIAPYKLENVLEESEYIYISPLTNDNLASYREEVNGSLGVLKINGWISQKEICSTQD